MTLKALPMEEFPQGGQQRSSAADVAEDLAAWSSEHAISKVVQKRRGKRTLVRMQADSLKPVSERRNYQNVVSAIVRTASAEGPLALWKGLTPNVLRGMAI